MDQNYRILTGDVSAKLNNLPDNFFDAVLSDPPYGISFMGQAWDKGVPSAATYRELSRVLKPGAMGLHFGGTRTWHRLACNMEDAGFELRDTVMWLYGSGFPKSHNISKAIEAKVLTGKASMSAQRQAAMGADYEPTELAGTPGYGNTGARYTGTAGNGAELAISTEAAQQWDGYGTALKPAWEPALLVQKPLEKTFAHNALAWGNGGLNIEGCRVGDEPVAKLLSAPTAAKGGSLLGGSVLNTIKGCELGVAYGRFPANLILDESAGAALDEQSGIRNGGAYPDARGYSGIGFASGQPTEGGARKMGDSGGASRFFYCAKPRSKERNAGLDGFADKAIDSRAPLVGMDRTSRLTNKNAHPTLKPIALTEYLARLLLVPKRTDGQPRRLLVPFSGAGSEMIGALKAGWDEVWGIEINPEYVAIAAARIAHHVPEAAPLDART